MALGIISGTCTFPGLIESTRVTQKFSPEFHFNLSQKQLARQATNKRRKPKVTPARLHHSKLSLKLHALQKRNTYLQSQSSHSSSVPVLPRGLQLSPSSNFARIQPYLHTSLKKSSGWDQPRVSLRMGARNKNVLMGHKVRIN